MFRYLEKANQTYANQVPYTEVEVSVIFEQEGTPMQEDHLTEQSDALVLEANEEVVHNVSADDTMIQDNSKAPHNDTRRKYYMALDTFTNKAFKRNDNIKLELPDMD
ncbi:hypothetical protein POM88_020379 [Heracleum sosnowskyi]|uniref:Uncharacterized protein n=1 Tax=Heracleum sosnowskyi TaxID=360622 RepID=A0AAD8IBS7_9APIA|nr:hypothetical protein POM88_020371 [Heracleum sosnowskyi]KAK1382640.1 hypothetical protein POM88_020375 [Heracleum sosnowskyi]KAK1382644.1 hypothetical protein POM88_020379 [Heracleum sosnowskyi]